MTSRIPVTLTLLPALLLLAPASGYGDNVRSNWSRPCPPNGYGVAQPALDLDTHQDGTKDAWNIPLTLTKAGGGAVNATDAAGNMVYLPAIPHSAANLGGPDGHYSPRLRIKGGAKEGVTVGQCIYPCGRNTWTLCLDAKGNFTKSEWISRDYEQAVKGTGAWTVPTGKSKTFTYDVAKRKFTAAAIDRQMAGGLCSFTIPDAVVFADGTDFSTVVLDGAPIGLPAGDAMMVQENADSTASNSLTGTGSFTTAGDTITVDGVITNLDSASHEYAVARFGVNASGLTGPSGTFLLSPGQTASYQVSGIVVSAAPAALVTYAYAIDTCDPKDNDVDTVVFVPAEPDTLMPGKLGLIKPTLLKLVAKGTFSLPDAAHAPTNAPFGIWITIGDLHLHIDLDPANWKGLGKPPGFKGYKYKGPSAAEPCKVWLIKKTVIKGVCKDTGKDIGLTPPFTAPVQFMLGTGGPGKNYCAEFGGTPVKNEVGVWKAKDAPAPSACPPMM